MMDVIDRCIAALAARPATSRELAEALEVPDYRIRQALAGEVFRKDPATRRPCGRITVRKGDDRYCLGDPTPLHEVER